MPAQRAKACIHSHLLRLLNVSECLISQAGAQASWLAAMHTSTCASRRRATGRRSGITARDRSSWRRLAWSSVTPQVLLVPCSLLSLHMNIFKIGSCPLNFLLPPLTISQGCSNQHSALVGLTTCEIASMKPLACYAIARAWVDWATNGIQLAQQPLICMPQWLPDGM